MERSLHNEFGFICGLGVLLERASEVREREGKNELVRARDRTLTDDVPVLSLLSTQIPLF
jgi:hypothetical protein